MRAEGGKKTTRERCASFVCARVFGAQRQRMPNEEKTTDFLHPKSPHNIYEKRKEKDEIDDFVMRGIIFIK